MEQMLRMENGCGTDGLNVKKKEAELLKLVNGAKRKC
jgi:hypothetical protein